MVKKAWPVGPIVLQGTTQTLDATFAQRAVSEWLTSGELTYDRLLDKLGVVPELGVIPSVLGVLSQVFDVRPRYTP